MGKQHRFPFPHPASWSPKEKLELVHTHVCGPMQTESLKKNKYFVLFIDDFTRMTWIYFIRYKSQVLDLFKIFKKMAEVKSGCKLKAISYDNRIEYNSKEFKYFFLYYNYFCDFFWHLPV